MSGNGTFDKVLGGIPESKYTHTDTTYRVEGHKVIVQTERPTQVKLPMNSNSKSPVYLVGRLIDKNEVVIAKVAIYEDHKIAKVIDLEYDKDGNIVPYSKGKGTHMHNWNENNEGEMGRKQHDWHNIFPVEGEYQSLIQDIVNFNNKKKTYDV